MRDLITKLREILLNNDFIRNNFGKVVLEFNPNLPVKEQIPAIVVSIVQDTYTLKRYDEYEFSSIVFNIYHPSNPDYIYDCIEIIRDLLNNELIVTASNGRALFYVLNKTYPLWSKAEECYYGKVQFEIRFLRI